MALVGATEHAIATAHAILPVVMEPAGSVAQPLTALEKDLVVIIDLDWEDGHDAQRRLDPFEVGPKGVWAQLVQTKLSAPSCKDSLGSPEANTVVDDRAATHGATLKDIDG
jgi:hypothetical protein